jgi:hypothetical protein
LHVTAHLGNTKEKHNKDEYGIDKLVEPELGIVVDDALDLLG